jgi:hypothetical protein
VVIAAPNIAAVNTIASGSQALAAVRPSNNGCIFWRFA